VTELRQTRHTIGASVAGGERIRLFCALCLPGDTVAALAAWQSAHLGQGRIVPAGNLHVTLAFLGNRSRDEVPAIASELAGAAARVSPLSFTVERYRETRSVGMVVLRDANGGGAVLAGELGERLERLGVYRREERPWLPHVTVLRFRDAPRLAPPLPELGEVSPSDAAVYSSVLRSDGAQYEVVEKIALGGR
jgi:RNA 2',3'-cyclic 3'-phosphodiesterase